MSFSYFRMPSTLIVGKGSIAQLPVEAKRLQTTKILIMTDKVIKQTGLLDPILKMLEIENLPYVVNDDVLPEPPFENLEQIGKEIAGQGFNLIVGIGGGSVLDTTKVLSILNTNEGNIRDLVGTDKVKNPGIPTILIPTTSGTGSEMTCNAIFTDQEDQVKKGIVSPYLLPTIAIVDPELTNSLPPYVTAATGVDALVHAIESFTSVNANDITDTMAIQAIRLISQSIRQAVYNPTNLQAREEMALGSLMAGISFGNAGVGAVHALAYPLGGKFHVPHGISNSLLLPYVLKYNFVSNIQKFSEIAKAMGENIDGLSVRQAAEQAIRGIEVLVKDLNIPRTLKEIGVTKEDIPLMAHEASKIDRLLNNNPRWLTVKEIEEIYMDALGD